MELIIDRERLLKPLQLITNTVDRKQALPILSNILFNIENQRLMLLGTDLEIELIQYIDLEESVSSSVEMAIPAKKLHDICRALPSESMLHFSKQENQLLIRSGRSRFILSLMSPEDFPTLGCNEKPKYTFSFPAILLKNLFSKTYFSIALQDVRYFLNGLFLDFYGSHVTAVAMDGHRLAMSSRSIDFAVAERIQVLLPRKAVLELIKLLENGEELVDFCIGNNFVSVRSKNYCFTTKLIEATFPEYRTLLSQQSNPVVVVDKSIFYDALSRVAVLSNEKYRGAWLNFTHESLILQANNPDKDEVEEELPIDYSGPDMQLGCNVTYLQEVLSVIEDDLIRIYLGQTSMLIQGLNSDQENYVVMSMRL